MLKRLESRREVVDSNNDNNNNGEAQNEEENLATMDLRRLHMRALERGPKLRNDVAQISSRAKRPPPPATESQQQQRPRLAAFTQHIRAATPARPHLLLAYTWVLYMALFSGGRYIRSRLRQAGAGFWKGGGEGEWRDGKGRLVEVDEDEKGDAVDGFLGFWTFEGEHDGADIKAEFEARFAAVEAVLTEGEREEVVWEAVFVMRSMLEVVEEIAEVLGTGVAVAAAAAGRGHAHAQSVDDDDDGERISEGQHEHPSMRWLLLKHVLPIGVVELIAAGARSALGVSMGSSFWGMGAT